jgi:Rho-binding antiterminator
LTDEPYTPIDCDFHDELEASATIGKRVTLILRTDGDDEERVTDEIVDLGHARPGEASGEYMTLRSGRRVRFDRIVSIDGKVRPV